MSEENLVTSERLTTREHIICVAEKLFAEEGIDQISLRQITQAAGQKNASAIHYHFGSKDALVDAIYDLRMGAINRRRAEMFADLKSQGKTRDLYNLVDAVVQPLAECLLSTNPTNFYVQFAARAMEHPRYYKMAWRRGKAGRAFAQLFDAIEDALPDLPPEVFSQRFGMSLRQVFRELSVHHQTHLAGRNRAKANTALFVSNLVDSMTAALSAPISARTQAHLASN